MCFPGGPVNPPPPFGAHVCIQFYFVFILLTITCGSSLILRITFISAYHTKWCKKWWSCVTDFLFFSVFFHGDQQLEVCVGSTGINVDVQVMKEQTGWNSSFFPFIIIEILCAKGVWPQRAVLMLAAHWRVLQEHPAPSCSPEGMRNRCFLGLHGNSFG